MNYYFSLFLAISFTSFNSFLSNSLIEFRNIESKNIVLLTTQIDSKNTDNSRDDQFEANIPESIGEPEVKKINNNLLLGAIAITSVLTIFLLSLLWQKVELNLNDETSEELEKASDNQELPLKEQQEKNLDAENILGDKHPNVSQISTSSTNSKVAIDEQLSENELYQDQDTVILKPSQSLEKLDAIEELILKLPSRDRDTRRETIAQLAQQGDARAMKPLIKLIKKSDIQERNLILETIKQITNNTLKTINHALIQSLTNENSQINQDTIRDLNSVYELMSEVTEKLAEAVDVSEQTVQDTTEWSLKQLQQMPVIPTVNLESFITNTETDK